MTHPTEQRAPRTRTPAWVWIVLVTLVVLGASIAVLVSEVRDRSSDVTEDVSDLNDGVSTMNDELTTLIPRTSGRRASAGAPAAQIGQSGSSVMLSQHRRTGPDVREARRLSLHL
jgi:hypothetical protein